VPLEFRQHFARLSTGSDVTDNISHKWCWKRRSVTALKTKWKLVEQNNRFLWNLTLVTPITYHIVCVKFNLIPCRVVVVILRYFREPPFADTPNIFGTTSYNECTVLHWELHVDEENTRIRRCGSSTHHTATERNNHVTLRVSATAITDVSDPLVNPTNSPRIAAVVERKLKLSLANNILSVGERSTRLRFAAESNVNQPLTWLPPHSVYHWSALGYWSKNSPRCPVHRECGWLGSLTVERRTSDDEVPGSTPDRFSTRYRTAGLGKRVRSTSLYHSRQCGVVPKPLSDRIDYTVDCFMTHICSQKLRKQFVV